MLIFISVALLAQILSVLGQNAIPTNSTLPAGLAVDSQLLCLYNDQYRALSPQYNVDFAVDASTGQKSGPIVAQVCYPPVAESRCKLM